MRYTKTESGLTNAQDIPKIKNFACAEAVCDALDTDTLQPGDVFSIPVVNGIFDDMSAELAEIKSYIPNSTSIENQLTNVSQVQEMISSGGASFDACWVRLSNVEDCANTNHSNIVQIGAVIPSDATSANQLVTNATMTSGLNYKVDCSDFNTTVSGLNTSISNLESCPGINCTGTLVPSDLSAINTGIACLNACPGLDCTGTLVPSDLTSINNSISNLNTCTSSLGTAVNNLCSCAGLRCTGTLVASDLTSINSDIAALKSCPGLKCTGTSTATFSLSGTTLTITV